MDFFEHQEIARKKTGLLLFYFALAVVLIVACVNVALYLLLFGGPQRGVVVQWELFAWVSGVIVAIIAIGTLQRMIVLKAGGVAVAGLLGARRVLPDTAEAKEKVLLNVVEEMAIASGMTVPPVFLIEGEPGINAFAAGFSPSDSVVVVTQGTLQNLSRDELQGVMAHEIAHLLNGDSRLNLRLVGVLGGLMLLSSIGRGLMRARSRGRRDGRTALIGAALYVFGAMGVFFGRLIQAAVSRQREFLADASAVQFTRNPSGIGGALLKIGRIGSEVKAGAGAEVSHFFFAQSFTARFFTGWFATHPDVESRIRAIDPALLSGKTVPPSMPSGGTFATLAGVSGFAPAGGIQEAARVLKHLPDSLHAAVRVPGSAQGAVAALLLEKIPEIRKKQLSILSEYSTEALACASNLANEAESLPREERLVLLELAVGTLKALSLEVRGRFIEVLRRLIAADGQTTVFEFALLSILSEQLLASDRKGARVSVYSIERVLPDCARVLSLLAYAGGGAGRAEFAFRKAMAVLTPTPQAIVPLKECKPADLLSSLHRLRGLSPGLKREFVEAIQVCVLEDGQVKASERELVRAIGLSVDAPIAIG